MTKRNTASEFLAPIPEGAYFLITVGEYSGYCVTGLFRANQEINIVELKEKHREEYPDSVIPTFRGPYFPAWLVKNGIAEELNFYEYWNGGLDDEETVRLYGAES